MAKKKIIVVGLGSIGRRHARLLAERPDVELAFCDPQNKMLAIAVQEIGDYETFQEFDDAVNSEPDMMVIATPHHLHVEQTIQAIQNNIHVLCEKPVSNTLSEAQRLCDESKKHPAVVNIGFHLHFNPALLRLKKLITSGELGEIIHAHCRVGSYITLVNSKTRYQATMEGALLMDYAHQPDLMYWLLNQKPECVHLLAGKNGNMEFSADPNFLSMTLGYQKPIISTIHLNYLQMPERHEYELVGDEGWAVLEANSGYIRIGHKKDNSQTTEHLTFERDQIYRDEHQAFFDAIEGKRKPESSPEDGLISMMIIDGALRSWKEKKTVTLE